MATTLRLPLLFYVEDNGYGISVRSELQTPGGNIAANLASFANLTILDGDGTDPREAASLTERAVALVRSAQGPVLLRLTVPRLCGHSGQDTQAYKSSDVVALEKSRDPIMQLQKALVPGEMSASEWSRTFQNSRSGIDSAAWHGSTRPMGVTLSERRPQPPTQGLGKRA